MKKIKRAYYYLFYKFYKMSEAAPSKWWSEWKASFALDILIYILIISIFIYYKIFLNRYIHLSDCNLDIIITVLIVAGFNYFIFNHRDQWKEIVSHFDKLPEKKNKRGGVIVWAFIFLIIANLIFAFYLMSQVDWSRYR